MPEEIMTQFAAWAFIIGAAFIAVCVGIWIMERNSNMNGGEQNETRTDIRRNGS